MKDKVVLLCVLALHLATAATVRGPTPVFDTAKYKCGSECDESKMGTGSAETDAKADAMPHTFAPTVPTGGPALEASMNSLGGEAGIPDQVAHPHLAMTMPEANDDAATPFVARAMDKASLIPYNAPSTVPASRRPCNLDKVMDIVRGIKDAFQQEDDHDKRLKEAMSKGNAALSAAKARLDDANAQVQTLEAARVANDTLFSTLKEIEVKADVIQELSKDESSLILEEGLVKAPIVKAIGRTNINLQETIAAKQSALNNFAAQPGMSKHEMVQVLSTYDELIVSIKKQLDSLHKEASDVLMPIQLKINSTRSSIERLQNEIESLKEVADQTIPSAKQYTAVALDAAIAVREDAQAHFEAQQKAHLLNLNGIDQREKDRSSIMQAADRLLLIVGDIQQPQDVADVYAESTVQVPESLAGSVAKPMEGPQ